MPRIYTDRLSAKRGDTVVVYASFDRALPSGASNIAQFTVLPVQDFSLTGGNKDANQPAGDAGKEYVVSWRAAVSTGAAIDPLLLFWRQQSGSVFWAVAQMTGHGNVVTLSSGSWPHTAVTHVTAVAGDMLFLYNADRGDAAVIRIGANGAAVIVRQYPDHAFSKWSSVATIPRGFTASGAARLGGGEITGSPEPVFFYDKLAGRGAVGIFDSDGAFTELWSSGGFTKGWTHVVSTWQGRLFFYDRLTGRADWGWIDRKGAFVSQPAIHGIPAGWDQIVPAGNQYLLFYRKSDGLAALAELHEGFQSVQSINFSQSPDLRSTVDPRGDGPQFLAGANGCVLVYNPGDGEAFSIGFTRASFVVLRTYPAFAFSNQADHWQGAAPFLGAKFTSVLQKFGSIAGEAVGGGGD